MSEFNMLFAVEEEEEETLLLMWKAADFERGRDKHREQVCG